MSATGQRNKTRCLALQAFTLVELILVMAILSIAVAIAAPSLSPFFRGRTQDAEARRMLSLIHYGQSRATADGVPVLLWLDIKGGTYGLEQDPTYVDRDPKGVEFELDSHLALDTQMSPTVVRANNTSRSRVPLYATIRGRNLPAIRFLSDGTFGTSSPAAISIAEGDSTPIWIVQSHDGLTYEIENQNKRIQAAFR